MKTFKILSVLVLLTLGGKVQSQINKELKQKLDAILYTDQTLRELFDNSISEERKNEILTEFGYTQDDFKKRFFGIVADNDSPNIEEIKDIISKYGYPGKTLVGEPTNEAAWYVIQHSNKIEQYYPLIEKAGKEGELPKRLVAMMQDRLLMNQERPQIYGTQVAGRSIGESDKWFQFVWPIENPESVNQRRKEVGFDLTVEENSKRLGINYKIYTLKQIDSILNPK